MSNDGLMMTPEQIEEMLRDSGRLEGTNSEGETLKVADYLTEEEIDVLGEIGNISMGTSATTLFQLLGKKVTITTPKLTAHTLASLEREYPAPIVVVEVCYIEGIDGNNLLLLKEYDVALITDLLMGGEGHVTEPVELDEIHLSAIREVMNQMVGSSATALSNILGKPVNISTPQTKHILLSQESISEMLNDQDILIKVSFQMEIEGVLNSEIMQVLPCAFAKKQVATLLGQAEEDTKPAQPMESMLNDVIESTAPKGVYTPEEIKAQQQYASPPPQPQYGPPPQYPPQQQQYAPPQQQYAPPPSQYGPPPQYPPQQQYYAPPPQYAPPVPAYAQEQQMTYANNIRTEGSVNAQSVEYQQLSGMGENFLGLAASHLGMIMDVPMNVTVQLGKTKNKIKEIMELNTGSIIVLDKLAGEYVEVLVNGTQIAKGEVVVVDDNYGVRITEINIPQINQNL